MSQPAETDQAKNEEFQRRLALREAQREEKRKEKADRQLLHAIRKKIERGFPLTDEEKAKVNDEGGVDVVLPTVAAMLDVYSGRDGMFGVPRPPTKEEQDEEDDLMRRLAALRSE